MTEESILQCRDNLNEEAFKKVMDYCKPMINYWLFNLRVPNSYREDVMQECCLEIPKALRLYNPQKGKFINIAHSVFRFKVRDCMKKIRKPESILNTNAGSYTQEFGAESDLKYYLENITPKQAQNVLSFISGGTVLNRGAKFRGLKSIRRLIQKSEEGV